MISILQATSVEQLSAARELFLEYANSLGFSLCFQGFNEEVANLPGAYGPPGGRLLLAYSNGELAGCGAFRPLDAGNGVCEMKRLYTRPAFRGQGLGRALALELLRLAKQAGYTQMRLDTVADSMRQAVSLYRALGFREIAPYNDHPIAGTLFMEIELESGQATGLASEKAGRS